LFEIASDGTLFLDEIGEMELTIQARLLKALEEKRFRRVGGVRDLRAGFRLIAATNRDLSAEVGAQRFRRDLYYRLNVVPLHMPPLRERMEDVPILVQAILGPLARELGRPLPSVSASAMKKLTGYPWPGNIRELRNVLESSGVPAEEWEIEPLDRVVNRYIAAAVNAAGGNMRKAARCLGISPSTLYARLKEGTDREA
jgi:DNA-binding NtrC family response regulator